MPSTSVLTDRKYRDDLIRHAWLEGQELASPHVKAELNIFDWDWVPADPEAWRPSSAQSFVCDTKQWEEAGEACGSEALAVLAPSAAHRFRALADRWLWETRLESSGTRIVLHPAYQQIIGMGWAVVPLILRSLQEDGAPWFWALSAITGENPVPSEDAGRIRRKAEHWLGWGRDKGLIP